MSKYPKIGFDTALRFLDDVLLPAYMRFTRTQTRANALEVAQAAWHLHERYWHDKGRNPELGQFRADLFRTCPELHLMRDYAEAGKHFELNRPSVQLVSITGSENPGGVDDIVGPLGMEVAQQPHCTLTMNVGDKTYSVPEVLKRVVEFWSKELR